MSMSIYALLADCCINAAITSASVQVHYKHEHLEQVLLVFDTQLAIWCAGITCTHAFAWEQEVKEMPKCSAGILARETQIQAVMKNQLPFHPSKA